jgi:hypothetical protein
MRSWEGSDNLVQSFSIQPWGLSSKRKSTKSIGSEVNLHRIDLLDEPNLVEAVFGGIETRFADAKWKAINKGITALDRNERENFAFFVALLANRRPEKNREISTDADSGFRNALGDELFNADRHKAAHVTKILADTSLCEPQSSFPLKFYRKLSV